MRRLPESLGAMTVISFVLLGVSLVRPGFAGTQPNATIMLHAQAHTTKSTTICTSAAPTVPCSQYVTQWPLHTTADVYLVVARAQMQPGIAGLSCGIEYDNASGGGVDIFGYELCADLEFSNAGASGEWPAAGGGNRITWDRFTNCQRSVIDPDGVHAIACAFYVYAYGSDLLRVTPNMNLESGAELAVADCSASTTFLPYGGLWGVGIGFGGAPGCNPCSDAFCVGDVPVVPTTWSRLKQRFGE